MNRASALVLCSLFTGFSLWAQTPLVLREPAVFPKTVTAVEPPDLTPVMPSSLRNTDPQGVSLWVYDPDHPDQTLKDAGVFFQTPGNPWIWVPLGQRGVMQFKLPKGPALIDVVEPPSLTDRGYTRKRYAVTILDDGTGRVEGMALSPNGYWPVTVNKPAPPAVESAYQKLEAAAQLPVSSFVPASPAQLLDAVNPNRGFAADLSAGFPKVRTRLPSTGRLRALIVGVDFPEIRGSSTPVAEFSPLARDVRDFYAAQSFGTLAFDFTIVPNWVHLPFSIDAYHMGQGNNSGNPNGYFERLLSLTDSSIPYSDFDVVYFLAPPQTTMQQMSYGPAVTAPFKTRSGVVVNGAVGGGDLYYAEANGVEGARWKWMAHETGHLLGLHDEDWKHETPTLGSWSLMANNWSNGATELGAWDRFLQGWLKPEQITVWSGHEVFLSDRTATLTPLGSSGSKAAMVVLSPTKVLVAELRQSRGYDHLTSEQEGVLVYTVDMTKPSLGGAYQTVRRTGTSDPELRDAALHPGDAVTVDGLRVAVLEASGDTASIQFGTRPPRIADSAFAWSLTKVPLKDAKGRALDPQWVAFGNGLFVATGFQSSEVLVASDGMTWSTVPLPIRTDWAVTFGAGRFLAYNGKSSVVSTDGRAWKPVAGTGPTHLAFGSPQGFLSLSEGTQVDSSSDGETWTSLPTLSERGAWVSGARGNGHWVFLAGGDSLASGVTVDGTSWKFGTLPKNRFWRSVAWGNGVFVAVAASASIGAVSRDGVIWQQTDLPRADYGWNALAFGDGYFVALASHSQKAAVSVNGIEWSELTLPKGNFLWSDIAFGNGRFVAVAGKGPALVGRVVEPPNGWARASDLATPRREESP